MLEPIVGDDNVLDKPDSAVIALTSPVSVAAADSREAKMDAPMTVEAAPVKPVKGLALGTAVNPAGMVVMGRSRTSADVAWSIQPSVVLGPAGLQ